jgi:hypothetical protein
MPLPHLWLKFDRLKVIVDQKQIVVGAKRFCGTTFFMEPMLGYKGRTRLGGWTPAALNAR